MSEQPADGSSPVDASSPVDGSSPVDDAADGAMSAERTAARLAAHRLLIAVQDEPPPDSSDVTDLIEVGDRNHWHEVSVIARCAEAVAAGPEAGSVRDLVDDMCRRAETSRDLGLFAMALGFRSFVISRPTWIEGLTSADAEADLAAAVVMLEPGEGGSLERAAAHNTCGVSFSMMGLWELAVEQYEAAADIDPIALEPALADYHDDIAAMARAVLYNRVEAATNYACALRVADDEEAASAQIAAALRHYEAVRAEGEAWSPSWLADLETCALLADALAGRDVSDRARAICARPEEPGGRSGTSTMRTGNARLALAVSLAHGGQERDREGQSAARAREAAESAIDALQHSPYSLLTLAMKLAADLEGAPAATRLARAQTEKLWTGRRRSVDSMEALIRTERLRARSEELERHAHVDDLTGLANRRGFYRYLNELLAQGRTRVSLLVVDIDRFKDVNDRYGHLVGDRALRRLAGVLARLVRPRDIAARLGGDEFFVLLEGTGAQVAIERAQAIVDAVAQPGPDDGDVALSVTVGVSSGPPDEFDRLLAEADNALYRGKTTGGGRWVSSSAPSATNR